jgi:tetratricopeptide (TPR) repeat protein
MKALWNSTVKGTTVILVIVLLSSTVFAQADRKIYRDYFMTGFVRDNQGFPVSGARVIAVFEEEPGLTSEASTNEQGKWTLRFLGKGRWIVSALTTEMISEFQNVILDSNKNDILLVLTQTVVEFIIEAKTAIYNDEPDKAIQILSWFIEYFPESPELGGALFWISYTYERLSQDHKSRGEAIRLKQKALSYLDRLITNLPESNWRDQAEILQITIAHRLYQLGRQRYAEIIENGLLIQEQERIDIKLAAIDALQNIDPARAFRLLSDIALNCPEPDGRKKAVFILGQSRTKEALKLLEQIAKQDPESSVRKAAVIWLER